MRRMCLTIFALLVFASAPAFAQQPAEQPPDEPAEEQADEPEEQEAQPDDEAEDGEEESAGDEQSTEEEVEEEPDQPTEQTERQAPEPPENCTVAGSITLQARAAVACEDGRVVVEAGGRREVRQAPGRVDGVVESGGDILVLSRQQLATSVDQLSRPVEAPTDIDRPAEPAEEPEPEPETVVQGEIVESELDRVVIDLGTNDGLETGDSVDFFVEQSVELAGGESAVREEKVATAVVESTSENHAEVILGLNERVPSEAIARPAQRTQAARGLAPPRLGSISRVSFALRPFLALDTLGVGTVSDALVAYHFDGPWSVEALFEPAAIGVGREGTLTAATGMGLLTYDTHLFQIGLGAGATTINTTQPRFHQEDDTTRGALAITQKIRLGALDGLNAEVTNAFFYAGDAFRYGGLTAKAQIPLGALGNFGGIGQNLWFVSRGGGSYAGHSFGEVGLRVLMRGNGDHGSVFLTPTVGGASIRTTEPREIEENQEQSDFRPDREEVEYAGPMVGLQVEYRP